MISAVSEDALLLTLADQIHPDLPARLKVICDLIERQHWPWLVDLVPSYTTLLIVYDLHQVDFRQARQAIQHLLDENRAQIEDSPSNSTGRLIELPIYYSRESGPDLDALAEQCNMSTERLIDIHSSQDYQVYGMGFAPGFAFLGEVDPCIAAPRKETPRTKVPLGSVGIANRQTAVYPVESPGGWQLIGRCPTRLFDPENLSLFSIGDRVQFHPISRDEYIRLGGSL